MPNAEKKSKARQVSPREAGYLFMPWSCNHYPSYSELVAYIPITGDWEVIADIRDGRGVDAEIVAGLITRAVNSYEKSHEMIAQMTAVIELCLECGDCLTWEAEHDAQAVLRKAGRAP